MPAVKLSTVERTVAEANGVKASVAGQARVELRRRLEEGDGLGLSHRPFRGRRGARHRDGRAAEAGGEGRDGGDKSVHGEDVRRRRRGRGRTVDSVSLAWAR